MKALINVITTPTINHLHVFSKQAITKHPPPPPRRCSLVGVKPGRRQIQLSVMRVIVWVYTGKGTPPGSRLGWSEQASLRGLGLNVKGRARGSRPREERGEWDFLSASSSPFLHHPIPPLFTWAAVSDMNT